MRTRRELYADEIKRANELGDEWGASVWQGFYDEARDMGLLDLPAPFDFDEQGNVIDLFHMLTAPKTQPEA